MKTPNFFIIGAPKCGTTALSEYLRKHPNVFFSTPKEPNFFNSDHAKGKELEKAILSLDEYLTLFRDADEKHFAVGEGTVNYLRSEVAVKNILAFNEGARMIAMVRNPIDLAHSFHSQLLRGDQEDTISFEQAWRKQEARKLGSQIPKFCSDPEKLQYAEVAKQGKQLGRVLSVILETQLKVIVFDDFAANPVEIYKECLEFLELSDFTLDNFSKVNSNQHARSQAFKYLIRRIMRKSSQFKRRLGVETNLGILRRLDNVNMTNKPRSSLSPSFEEELKEFFKQDVQLLSELLQRDLSSWLKTSRRSSN